MLVKHDDSQYVCAFQLFMVEKNKSRPANPFFSRHDHVFVCFFLCFFLGGGLILSFVHQLFLSESFYQIKQ